MSITEIRQEEREAHQRQRRLDKLQKDRERYQARELRTKLSGIIRDELSKPRARTCRCGITPRTTPAELAALGEGCTGGGAHGAGFICPTLDAIRRRREKGG